MKLIYNVVEKLLGKYPKVDNFLYGNEYRSLILIAIFGWVVPVSSLIYIYLTSK